MRSLVTWRAHNPSVPSTWNQLSNTWKSHPGTAVPAHLVLQVPDAVLVGELLVAGAALGQDAALEAAHVEQQVGVVLAVHRHEAVLPLHRGHRAGQTVLDVPEHSTATAKQDVHSDTSQSAQITTGQVHRASITFQDFSTDPSLLTAHPEHLSVSNSYLSLIFLFLLPLLSQLQHSQVHVVLHEAHASIPGPALLVIVAHDVLVVGVWVLCQVPLDQVSCLISCKPGNAQKRIWNYVVNVINISLARKIRILLGKAV